MDTSNPPTYLNRMTALHYYFKSDALHWFFNLHPLTAIIALDVLHWCVDNGIQPMVSATASTFEMDTVLGRVSATHREGRAFDLSTHNFTLKQVNDCIKFFSDRYDEYAATNQAGEKALAVYHDAGTGYHLHFQVSREFALPLINSNPVVP